MMIDLLLPALIGPGITPSSLHPAASLDRSYGASALLLLEVGFSLVYWDAKGSSFYLLNPLFWTKVGLFAVVAVLSIPPALQFIRWTKQAHSHRNFRRPTGSSPYSMVVAYRNDRGRFDPFLATAMARGVMPFIAV
jgi:putative membrane protein